MGVKNMKTSMKTLSKEASDGIVIVKREVTEEYNQSDVMQKKQQLQFRQQEIIRQMNSLKTQYDSLSEQIAECDEIAANFTVEIPTIG
jgi:hypothetical protein